jgi:hypothetical protein
VYHLVRSPEATSQQMLALVDVARETLAFALTQTADAIPPYADDLLEQRELVSALRSAHYARCDDLPFLSGVREAFIASFGPARFRVGTWLWNHPVAIAAPVVRLLSEPQAEKQDFLTAFDIDIHLEALFQHEDPVWFRYPSLPGSLAKQLVCEIMVNFYKRILATRDGIPGYVLGSPTRLSRRIFLREHFNVNTDYLKVCPGCDGSPPPLSGEDLQTDVDHFFPESKYPFLSVHPANLTPYCETCNHYKHAKDAYDVALVEHAGLYGMCHPYRRPGRDEIQVHLQRIPRDYTIQLQLFPNHDTPQNWARLESLRHLFTLDVWWQGALDRQKFDKLFSSILQPLIEAAWDSGAFHQHNPDDEWLIRQLSTIIKIIKGIVGQVEFATATLAYAQWKASDETERAMLLQAIEFDFNARRA